MLVLLVKELQGQEALLLFYPNSYKSCFWVSKSFQASRKLSQTGSIIRTQKLNQATSRNRIPEIEMVTPNSLIIFIINCVLIASTLLSSSPVLAKSRRPDSETRQKKQDCYADIESGLWGPQCKSSMIATENCALWCLSPPCYELVYKSDPLEEGENDYVRSQEYKYCMHKLSLGESLEGIRGSFDY